MLRVIVYILGLALLVTGAVWLADHPGAVTLQWLGWRLETSMPVLLGALLAVAVVLVMAIRALLFLWRLPTHWAEGRRETRRRKGYQALSDGLAAAVTGEAAQAHKQATRARKLLQDPGLTTFLSAQAETLAGNPDAARQHYTDMLERPETAALGLRGLLDDALKQGDEARALELAERARAASPGDSGLAEILYPLLVKAGRLEDAQNMLVDAVKQKAMSGPTATHRRAQVLHERALRLDTEGDRRTAFSLVKQAVAADPSLTAAAVTLARFHHEAGNRRRAESVLTKAWRAHPAPELVPAWIALDPAPQPLPHLRRLEKLVAGQPTHPQSRLTLAEAALAAKLWGQARKYLSEAEANQPTARVYALLAELEEAEYQNHAAAEAWRRKAASAAADFRWVCSACGAMPEAWSLICPHCGEVDTLTWKAAGQQAP